MLWKFESPGVQWQKFFAGAGPGGIGHWDLIYFQLYYDIFNSRALFCSKFSMSFNSAVT